MSSEFERLLRQAREALPEPDAGVTARARDKALAAVVRRRRVRFRSPLTLAAALVVAVGLGIGLGALLTPSGSASDGPRGLGFLPEQGWSVYQAGTRATVARPASALATNIPLNPADFVDGRPDPSQLPYSTLLTLPRNGVVIVANFTLQREYTLPRDRALFRPHKLPLNLRDAAPDDEYGTQIRPRRPLGQYQLRAAVNGYAVDLRFYFGSARPSRALIAAAQRQLDRLAVTPADTRRQVEPTRDLAARPTVSAGQTTERIIDRTFRCNVGIQGGIPKIEVTAQKGVRVNGKTKWFAQAGIVTFEEGDLREKNSLLIVGMTAGWPPPPPPPPVGVGGFGVSVDQCTPVVAPVPLSPRGLSGGPANPFGDKHECFPPKKILLRTRALFRKPTSLRFNPRGGRSLDARGRITEGTIVAATLKGKPIVYAQVFEAGPARLFTAPDCVEDTT